MVTHDPLGRFFRVIGLGSFVALVLIVSNDRIASLTKPYVAPNHIVVKRLTFEDGKFSQQVEPYLGGSMQGTWSASIFRKEPNSSVWDFICGSGGNGTYTASGEVSRFSPDDWTGADCGALIKGQDYIGKASWSGLDEDGKPYTTKGEVQFTY
jgi:hypothetical protein